MSPPRPSRAAWAPDPPPAVLEIVTGVPAHVFAGLAPISQAAVVARVVPERIRTLDIDAAEAVVAVTQRAINALGGLRDVAIAACVRAEEVRSAELDGEWVAGERHRPDAVKIVASSLAPMLGSTPRAMEPRVAHAVTMVDDMPGTLAAALGGELSERHVAAISRQAELLEPSAIPLYDRELHHDSGLGVLPPGRLARACERAALSADSDVAERRAARAVEDRFVSVQPGVDPGMAFWAASVDSLESARAWGAIDELAHEYVRADNTRSIDQARADAFVDLLLGNATVATTVELVVPIASRGIRSNDSSGGVPAEDQFASAARNVAPPRVQGLLDPPAAGTGRALDEGGGPSVASTVAGTGRAAGERGARIPARGESIPSPDLPESPDVLSLISGPPVGEWFAIGSELFGDGHPDLDGLPETAATKRLVMLQHEVTAREREEVARELLERHGVRLPPWRPPEFGVRDPRVGWVLTQTLLGILTDPDVVLRLTRAEATTGVTVARDPHKYRPNAALAQRVRDRDRTCRFPGCGVLARRCDIDHVRPFPGGVTSEENLVCLCRTHHGFKHHAAWTLDIDGDARCRWASPTGRSYVTLPADVRHDAA